MATKPALSTKPYGNPIDLIIAIGIGDVNALEISTGVILQNAD